MTLEQIKNGRIADLKLRMENAMYENWFGGDTLLVKNVMVKQEGSEYGLTTQITNQFFTANELELIERENILDEIRKEGWEIETQHIENGDFIDVQWLFRAVKI